MKKMIAIKPILYGIKQYKPGDILPDDPEMMEAWKRAGSARELEEKAPSKKRQPAGNEGEKG